jgi:transposase
MIMGGRASVRTALDMPTLTAIRRNRGRPAKVAITACMRKLLTILNAILRDHLPPGWPSMRNARTTPRGRASMVQRAGAGLVQWRRVRVPAPTLPAQGPCGGVPGLPSITPAQRDRPAISGRGRTA